jgi:hypothetical protein
MQTLCEGGGVRAFDAGDEDPVTAALLDAQGVEVGGDIGVEVLGAANLVHDLRRDRPHGDRAAGVGVLGDGEGAIGVDLGPGIADIDEAGNLMEERVVAAGGLTAALDHMACRQRTGQAVPVVALPAELPGRGGHHHRRIGHPWGNDDVGPLIERIDHAPAAEIGVGGHRWKGALGQRHPLVHVDELLTLLLQLADAWQQVIAFDVGHLHLETELVGQGLGRFGAAPGVETAGIGDHLDAAVDAGAHHLLHLLQMGVDPAARAILQALSVEDHHGQLGQVIAGQHIDGTAHHQIPGGRNLVAIEAAAVADDDFVVGGTRHGCCSLMACRYFLSEAGRRLFCRQPRNRQQGYTQRQSADKTAPDFDGVNRPLHRGPGGRHGRRSAPAARWPPG